MDAARLRRARRRMRSYFLGSGVTLAFIYLIIAAFVVRVFGIEVTQFIATMMMAAGVMLAGTYAMTMLAWLTVQTLNRVRKRQPIWDVED